MSSFCGPNVPVENLIFYLDAANAKSLIASSFEWYDLRKKTKNILTNSPTYDESNGGSVVFDGINDSVVIDPPFYIPHGTPWTISTFFKMADLLPGRTTARCIIGTPLNTTPGHSYMYNSHVSNGYAIEKCSLGGIYLAGCFKRYKYDMRHLIKLNDDGTLDNTFNTGLGFDDTNITIYVLKETSDNKLYVGGSFTQFNGETKNRLIRLNSDGSLDETFDIGTGFNSTVYDIIEDSEGNVYVGGLFSSYKGISSGKIIKLDSLGGIIDDFNTTTGFRYGTSTSTGYGVNSISLSSDETKIYCGGTFTTYNSNVVNANRIACLNTSDGSLNTNFNMTVGANSTVSNVTWSPNGIYVGGAFTKINNITSNYVSRLNSDGSIDTNFIIGSGFNNTVNEIVIDASGSTYMGGIFSYYNGTAAARIIKLFSNGSIDTNFNTSSAFNSTVVYDIKLEQDCILMAGTFTSYKGQNIRWFIKISYDATMDTNFNTNVNYPDYEGYYQGYYRHFYKNSSNTFTSAVMYYTPFSYSFVPYEDMNGYFANKWFNLVLTCSSTELKFYENGVLKNTTNITGALDTSLTISSLGVYSTSSFPFQGNISTIKVYDKVLSIEEITQNYDSLRPRYNL